MIPYQTLLHKWPADLQAQACHLFAHDIKLTLIRRIDSLGVSLVLAKVVLKLSQALVNVIVRLKGRYNYNYGA